MTSEQREAHERMLGYMRVRKIDIDDDLVRERFNPDWPEKDRELTPAERVYLWDW